MPRFIMLCGPAACGKTTFRANLLEQSPDAIVISSDDILLEWAKADGISYQDAFHQHRIKTDDLMQDIASHAFEDGRDVIWDQTHLTRPVRMGRLEGVPDSYDRVAVAFKVPTSLLLDRAQERARATGKEIPEDILLGQAKAFEVPDYDEGFDQIVLVTQPGNDVRVI